MNLIERFCVAWKISDKAETLESLQKELRRLRDINADLDKQVRELLKAHPMTDAQLEQFAEVRRDNDQMRNEINVLTVYMRTRWPKDFQSGRHGSRSFSDIVIRYLSRIEDQHAAEA